MAVAFDADNEACTSTVVPAGSATMTVWAKLATDKNNYATIGGWFNGTSVYKYVCTEVDGTTLKFFGVTGIAVGPPLTIGTWYKIGAVYDGSSTATLYYGTEGSSLTSASNPGFSTGTVTSFRVGGSTFSTEFLNGSLAALKVWHTELSVAEIAAELEQYQPVRTDNLVRYHSFLTAPGLTDESGNGNNLTAGAAATSTDASGPNIPLTGGTPGELKAPVKGIKIPGA